MTDYKNLELDPTDISSKYKEKIFKNLEVVQKVRDFPVNTFITPDIEWVRVLLVASRYKEEFLKKYVLRGELSVLEFCNEYNLDMDTFQEIFSPLIRTAHYMYKNNFVNHLGETSRD